MGFVANNRQCQDGGPCLLYLSLTTKNESSILEEDDRSDPLRH